jgi:phosphate transport system protein
LTKHLDRELDHLNDAILSLSTLVEQMIEKASRALCQQRMDLAKEVIEADNDVDRREVNIEEECLKILALHQPVAFDLRQIASVIKVNCDLERIADLAVNIADRAWGVSAHPRFKIPEGVEAMVTRVSQMVRGALNAFVHQDVDEARAVLMSEDFVDQCNVVLIDQLSEVMRSNPAMVDPALHCFSAIRHLERIADLATNIAEDAIYLVDGEIVRHRTHSRNSNVTEN